MARRLLPACALKPLHHGIAVFDPTTYPSLTSLDSCQWRKAVSDLLRETEIRNEVLNANLMNQAEAINPISVVTHDPSRSFTTKKVMWSLKRTSPFYLTGIPRQ